MPRGLENYKPVKQRIHEFRQEHPDWGIRTKLEHHEGFWYAETTISDDTGHPIANGHAVETATKPFDAEKAETSSVGRALVFAGWTDSLELSQEELERSEGVHKPQKGPRVDPGPVTWEQAQKPKELNDTSQSKPPTLNDYMRLNLPPQSAPKGFWADYITGLVAITEHEEILVPWRDLTGGKGFGELTSTELKILAVDVDKWMNEPEVEA